MTRTPVAIVGVPGMLELIRPISPGAIPVAGRNIFWPFGQNEANSVFQILMTSCGVTAVSVSRTTKIFWNRRPNPPFAALSRRPRTLAFSAPATSPASSFVTGFAQFALSRAITDLLSRSCDEAARPADRRGEHVKTGADRGVLPDVLRLRPVPPPIDERPLYRHLPGRAEVRGERAERLRPHRVLGSLPVHREQGVVERVVGSDEDLYLRIDRVPRFALRAESDHPGGGVPCRIHERERLVVGVDHAHAGRQLHAAERSGGDEGHIA